MHVRTNNKYFSTTLKVNIMQILIAEDEPQIANSLAKNFSEEGFDVTFVDNGEKAISEINSSKFDVVLLDWKMPILSGFEVCKKMREIKDETPVIIITALSDISNKVNALNYGADDYITKPFSFSEVLARVKAVLRRANKFFDNIQIDVNLIFNLNKKKLIHNSGKEIYLSDKEAHLLKLFCLNKGKIISKEMLCKEIWDLSIFPQTNFCEVTIKKLRDKLDEISGKKFIKNIYGEGYIFIVD